MKQYLLILTQEEKNSLGTVRCMPKLQVADDGLLYLKGLDDEAMSDNRIKQLPVLHSYLLDEERRLFPLQGVTPIGRLNQLEWRTITDFLSIELPLSAMPAKVTSKLPVKLVESDTANEGYALMTNLATWKAYAEKAPAVRLEHLQFAVASSGDVLITGTPLPPVPGKEFYKDSDIFLPAGYAFEAPLIAAILKRKLNAASDAVLLFTSSDQLHTIPITSFVKASRSAVRLTTLNDLK